jgi:hypothetical protein
MTPALDRARRDELRPDPIALGTALITDERFVTACRADNVGACAGYAVAAVLALISPALDAAEARVVEVERERDAFADLWEKAADRAHEVATALAAARRENEEQARRIAELEEGLRPFMNALCGVTADPPATGPLMLTMFVPLADIIRAAPSSPPPTHPPRLT